MRQLPIETKMSFVAHTYVNDGHFGVLSSEMRSS